jgi:serine kinase of HPr protein (carbohydrate metabolism regulator)
MRRFKIKVANPFHNGDKRQVCVELVGYFLKNILKAGISEDLDSIGLKDIEYFVKLTSQRGVKL